MRAISVALALIWKDGRILISRRRCDHHLGGLWEFPGGKCEVGETPEQCAVREAFEETGVVCQAIESRPAIVHAYADRTVRLIPVDCRYFEGEARPLAVEEVRWAEVSELIGLPFPEANRPLLEALSAGVTEPRRERGPSSGTSSP